MEPRISFITLGVSDLARARAFYERGLGWTVSRASEGDVVFFGLAGQVFALYPRRLLALDACVPAGEGSGFSGVALAHNVRAREEVAAVLAQAEAAGARILKPAQETTWGGHHGYFADPDGHLWEIAWNPGFPLDDSGRLVLPDPVSPGRRE